MTTPTRNMAGMAHSPPSPPPSAARLEEHCILSSTLVVSMLVLCWVLPLDSFVVCCVVCTSSSVTCNALPFMCAIGKSAFVHMYILLHILWMCWQKPTPIPLPLTYGQSRQSHDALSLFWIRDERGVSGFRCTAML